jgi:hypothetical protein
LCPLLDNILHIQNISAREEWLKYPSTNTMGIVRPTTESRVSNCKSIVELCGFCILCAHTIDDLVIVSIAQVDFVWSDPNHGTCMLMSALSIDSTIEIWGSEVPYCACISRIRL